MQAMHYGTRLVRSTRCFLAAIATVSLFSVVACESTNSDKDAGGGGGLGNIVIKDQNNYKATSTLTIPRVQTAAGQDLKICWSEMKTDFLCHSLAPATDIDSLSFLQVQNRTEEQVEGDLGAGKSFAKYVVPRVYHADQAPSSTCANLSSFALDPTTTPPQSPVIPAQDYLVSSSKVYMILFSTGTKLGAGSKSMLFIEPSSSSTVTTVNAVADSCSILDFKADITSPTPIQVPAAGPFVVDWSSLTKDGMQNEVLFTDIDGLQLGFYKDATPASLQAKFLDMDRTAEPFYELALSGDEKKANLTSAVTSDGKKFAGFTQTNGIWAVALRCSTCEVPAPIALAILNPI